METIRTAIISLKKSKNALPKPVAARASADGTVKRGPGRPRKGEVVVKKRGRKTKRGPGRPPKPVRKERDLNKWDTMILNAVKSAGRLMPKEDLLKQAKAWVGNNEPGMKAAEVEAHLTRTLQKLSGRKKLLGTHHTGLRRGYHYGLKDWFFQSSGKLRRQHYDKLVLTKD